MNTETRPSGPTVLRAQLGDAAASERLYLSHRRRVYGLCLRMVRNPSDAEDLTQETFVQVVRNIHAFRGDSAFSTWLFRVTKDAVLMERRKKRPSCASLDEVSTEGVNLNHESVQLSAGEPAYLPKIQWLKLKQAIGILPPACQRVFVLHDVFGYPHRAIGGITGLSETNSKSHLRRARLRLVWILAARTGRKNRNPGATRCVSTRGR